MGHVDHAHHAEGDGEPDGGQQQHRAERKPVPEVLNGAPQRQLALDIGDCPRLRVLQCRRGVAGQRAQRRERILVAALAQHVDGGEAVEGRRVGLGDQDRGLGLAQGSLGAGVGFLADRGLEHRQHADIARLEHGLGRGDALAVSGLSRPSPPSAAWILRRTPLLRRTGLEARRFRGKRGAGPGVEQLAIHGLDDDRAASGQKPAIGQRLDDHGSLRMGVRDQDLDGAIGVGKAVGAEPGEGLIGGLGRTLGRRGARLECKQRR
jgi:hypothetical protein